MQNNPNINHRVTVLGAGLAGCEAALWLAAQGVAVDLYEQKPIKFSPAHQLESFAELVCSNSLKAERLNSPNGLLKAEMRLMHSQLLEVAEIARVPAGGALAVDRDVFSSEVTKRIVAHPLITVHRQEVTQIDESAPILIATGPMTEGALAEQIKALTGDERLHFYDAVAPIVTAESLDYDKIFVASRYDRGEADYLNCPFDKDGYDAFIEELVTAELAPIHDIDLAKIEPSDGNASGAQGDAQAAELELEKSQVELEHSDMPTVLTAQLLKKYRLIKLYDGCQPVEQIAAKGHESLRYGTFRPVGLINPNTGHRPWANVQLRAENTERTLYNLVGFQTGLKWGEQKRVFSMVPGLENAEFVRYGVMHRNTFLDSPKVLTTALCLQAHPNVFFAGQITGFEGYTESAASGLLAARNIYARLCGTALTPPPVESMCGALIAHITSPNKDFQPMGANMGILPDMPAPAEVEGVRRKKLGKQERYQQKAERAVAAFTAWVAGE